MGKVKPVVPCDEPEEGSTPTKEELADWKTAFKVFDKDDNGSIEFDELCEIMKNNGEKHNEEVLQEVFDSVDTDRSGAIDFDEFCKMMQNADQVVDNTGSVSMMNHKKGMSSNFFKNVAKKEAIKAKKARLAKWSTTTPEAQAKKNAEKQKEAARNLPAEIAKKAHKTELLGERAKLMWRTNTRLDIMIYKSDDDEVIVVQTSSKDPVVIYPLIYLDFKKIWAFIVKQIGVDSTGKKLSAAELEKERANQICNYVVSRMQLTVITEKSDQKGLKQSESAPAVGAAAAAAKPKTKKLLRVTKLSADADGEITKEVDPQLYPVPVLNVSETLSGAEWDEMMQGIANEIKQATESRENSSSNLNGMDKAILKLENLLNLVQFKKRAQLLKWSRGVLKMVKEGTLDKELKAAEKLRKRTPAPAPAAS